MTGDATPLSTYSYPTIVSQGSPHLEVFIPANNSIYWKYRSVNQGPDTAWYPSSGGLKNVADSLLDTPTSVASIGRVGYNTELYMTNATSPLHIWHTPTREWFPTARPERINGTAKTALSAVTWNGLPAVDLFYLGTDDALYHRSAEWQNFSWTDWSSIAVGPWATFVPTAVRWGTRLDVFVVNASSNAIYHTFNDGYSWAALPSIFESLGGYATSRPAAVSRVLGRHDIVVRGGDAGLWYTTNDSGQWADWMSISGNNTIQGEPEILSPRSDQVDIFAWSSEDKLVHKSLDTRTGKWTPAGDDFEILAEDLAGPPKGVFDNTALQLVWFSKTGSVQYLSYNLAAGTTSGAVGASMNLGTPGGS